MCVFCLAQLPVSAACSLNVGLKPALTSRRLRLLLWEYLPLPSWAPYNSLELVEVRLEPSFVTSTTFEDSCLWCVTWAWNSIVHVNLKRSWIIMCVWFLTVKVTKWPDILFVRRTEIFLIVAHPAGQRSVAHTAAGHEDLFSFHCMSRETIALYWLHLQSQGMISKCAGLLGWLSICVGDSCDFRAHEPQALSCKINYLPLFLCPPESQCSKKPACVLLKRNYGIMSLLLLAQSLCMPIDPAVVIATWTTKPLRSCCYGSPWTAGGLWLRRDCGKRVFCSFLHTLTPKLLL